MKIGIDARKIRDFGIGIHIENLLRYIPEYDAENRYIIFHYPDDREWLLQLAPNMTLIPETSPKYSIRELTALPVKMWQQKLDLFHAPHYTLPPLRPCQGIVTIHDVIHLRFPGYLPHPAAYYYAKSLMWAAAKSARKVITVSECSKQDLMHYLGLPDDKIVVIYNGIDVNSAISGSIDSLEQVQQQFGISRRYILYLGNFMPHKNLETLIRAFGIAKRDYQLSQCLVLAGKHDKVRSSLDRLIATEGLESDVILTGYVESHWLRALYAHASLFVYPSLYEGFGLQALEAMAHNVPVAISNVSSLPEVAGDAALRFDPLLPQQMAEVMHQGVTDQTLRSSLISKGQQRVKLFSWREMARRTVDLYHAVL